MPHISVSHIHTLSSRDVANDFCLQESKWLLHMTIINLWKFLISPFPIKHILKATLFGEYNLSKLTVPHRELLCKNARETSDRFFQYPLCHYSLMILKPVPTHLSDWHLIMISIEEQLLHILCLSMSSIQVLPFQCFYERAREMAGCQRCIHMGVWNNTPDIKRKNPSQTAVCAVWLFHTSSAAVHSRCYI